ncbi:MAG: DUF4286 family protein [Geminicoccaceae bacterium]
MTWLFVVSMNVDPAKEDLFNEVYDTEHVPFLLEVEGVNRVTRGRSEDFEVSIGGETKPVAAASPSYVAIYEIDDPAILKGAAWQEAVERGRWATEVRPHTMDRAHALYRKI